MKRSKRGRAWGPFAAVARDPYWREDEARVVLEEWSGSGLELEEFSRRHELNPGRLRRWSERLGQGRRLEFHPVKLRLDGLPTREPFRGEGGVSLVLSGGRRVAVERDFDEELLARVVRVLESWPC
jgi:hypothetical protein